MEFSISESKGGRLSDDFDEGNLSVKEVFKSSTPGDDICKPTMFEESNEAVEEAALGSLGPTEYEYFETTLGVCQRSAAAFLAH